MIGAPITLALNAISLQISGRITNSPIIFKPSYKVRALATAANVLPLPSGTQFHSAALIARGASIRSLASVVILGHLGITSLILILLGLGIQSIYSAHSYFLLTIGSAFIWIIVYAIARLGSWQMALYFLLARANISIVLLSCIILSFKTLDYEITWLNAAAFSGPVSMGTVIAIFPSGMGLSEPMAALTALALEFSAASAF